VAVASIGVGLFLSGGCWFFSLAMVYKWIWSARVSAGDEKSEKNFLIR
jgi:hypothetical protein